MDLEEITKNAHQTLSKLQTQTYRVSHLQMINLFHVVEEIAKKVPAHTDCGNLLRRDFDEILIDDYMEEIAAILSEEAEDGAYLVYVAINFTWKKHYRRLSLGEMRLWLAHTEYDVLQQDPQSLSVFRCVATHNKIRMDEILPEKHVVVLRRHAVSRPILASNIQPIFDATRKIFDATRRDFKKNETLKNLNKLVSLLSTKQNDTILYLNGEISSKKDDEGDAFIVKLNMSDEVYSHHYAIRIPADKPEVVRQFEDKLFRPADDPIRKLRSYAARMNLPFLEQTYHVPENVIMFFSMTIQTAKWYEVGGVLLEAQRQWAELPPFSGIFPIHFALCLQGNVFHTAAYSPYNNVKVETFTLSYQDELKARTREFFPDPKYDKDVRKHALDPTRSLSPEDSFLEPYISAHRSAIISQNVRTPGNKSLPPKLAGEIEKWRKHYTQKLRQHVSKHPQDAARLKQVLKGHVEQIDEAARHKQRQKSLRQFVYTNSTRQVPADNPFRQQIQQERRRVRQQAAKHGTPDDLADAVLRNLNLIDPIADEPIRDPVRSPYVPTGIYQKKNLTEWLSKSGRQRLDPLSRKVMPTTFEPRTDQRLKQFTQKLYPKIQKIMEQEKDDDTKKIRLLGLKQQLKQKKVFQNIITQKKK